jgi:hypothetical protein
MAKAQIVLSHWHRLIEEFQTSPLDFYAAVEAAIERRQIPDRRSVRIDFKEGGLLTARRVYLRIMRDKHSFDICAAPFGTGFFFSWWLTELPSQWVIYCIGLLFVSLLTVIVCFQAGFIVGILLSLIAVPGVLALIGNIVHNNGGSAEDAIVAIPWLGAIYEQVFHPATYYKIDTALMFQDAVHNAVMEVIDQVTAGKGVRAISEFERKPILKSFARSA